VNEFESKLLAQEEAQNATLIRLERALGELGKTQQAMVEQLHELGRRPNVVQLTRRVQRAEGEISELQGEVALHAAQIKNMAGGSNGG
jgi:biotin carboxylase